ncbi:MAG: 6-phosphogluconolactonase [Acidimicrobiales bacterium]
MAGPPVGEARVVPDVPAAFAELVRAEAPTSIALSGGGTAEACYRALARTDGVPWAAITVLFGDERWVPVDDPDSNEGMARQALLDHVSPAAVHSMSEAADDIDAAADAYGELLASLAPIQLVHLGLGEDGHTASLFPGNASLDEEVALVVATGDDAHPHPRLSLTYPAIAGSHLAVFTVSGAEKAQAWARVCQGDDLPATRITAGRVIWLLDPEAAATPDLN